ncbi:MAG: pyridoxal-phosphate dependent enzyme [Bacteroidetes bacterium]|nr:pyridoxal-phosphate dependent enzyme [Bacteroidota bacterium]
MLHPQHIPNTLLKHPLLDQMKVEMEVMRLDQVHPTASGNKFFKLKYNLDEALKQKHNQVLTFGGAYSNHIYATASAAKIVGLKSIGIIRGELLDDQNPTLGHAKAVGMILQGIPRELYREKTKPEFLDQLRQEFGEFYFIPEGGTNALAIQGTCEILSSSQSNFSHLATSLGTGGTFAGLASSLCQHQMLLGISALKGEDIQEEMANLLKIHGIQSKGSLAVLTQYHQGGYAKWTPELIDFIHWFWESFRIPLDPIYTGKMAFACWDLLQKNYFKPGSRVLLIHTGGLQGNLGFTQRTGIKVPNPLA